MNRSVRYRYIGFLCLYFNFCSLSCFYLILGFYRPPVAQC